MATIETGGFGGGRVPDCDTVKIGQTDTDCKAARHVCGWSEEESRVWVIRI